VSVFLGVDSGGTKTALCLVTETGEVAATVRAPGCYYLAASEGIALVGRVLRDGVADVCRIAGITPADIDYGYFALPTYGEVSADVPSLDAAPRAALGHDRYACGNDMVAGWAGSLGATDGINVVAGTGSICYGERAGQGVRVGGWGELFSDEGSGYWIAARGLQAFSQMSDGRLAPGPLLEELRSRLGVENDLDVLTITMVRWGGDRSRIASLSPAVVAAAESGDEQARAILTEAARHLVAMVDTARHHLGYGPGETVPVSHTGGVFSAAPVRDEFGRLLAATSADYELCEPLYSPTIGAALYAARLAGTPLAPAALSRLRSS